MKVLSCSASFSYGIVVGVLLASCGMLALSKGYHGHSLRPPAVFTPEDAEYTRGGDTTDIASASGGIIDKPTERIDVPSAEIRGDSWWNDLPPPRESKGRGNQNDDGGGGDDGMHVVFLGDSITRYLFLDLAYRVHRGGMGHRVDATPDALLHVDASTEDDPGEDDATLAADAVATTDRQPPSPPPAAPAGGGGGAAKAAKRDWMKFYQESLAYFNGSMRCDCSRSSLKTNLRTTVENRFYHHPTRRLSLTYLQLFGNTPMHSRARFDNYTTTDDEQQQSTTSPLRASSHHPPFPRGAECRLIEDPYKERWYFRRQTLYEVVAQYLPKLQPKITHVVINVGLWDPRPMLRSMPYIIHALRNVTNNVVWRTTSQPALKSWSMVRPGSKRRWASLLHPYQALDALMVKHMCQMAHVPKNRSKHNSGPHTVGNPPGGPSVAATPPLCYVFPLTPLPNTMWGSIMPQHYFVDAVAHVLPFVYGYWNADLWRFLRSI